MITNPLLASFASEPCLVEPSQTAKFQSCMAGAAAHPDFARLEGHGGVSAAADDYWPAPDAWEARYRPYNVTAQGILVIPVRGVLLHNFPWQMGSLATGYDYVLKAVERGMDDGNVRGIALVCDTPGGMVAGCFEAADRIYARRGEKPIRAFAHEAAYSAGYAIASVADQIVVSKTGGVGSIGVVTMHVDYSKALESNGIAVTFIHAGKHKVDGNPYQALPEDVRARIQERIDELYAVFVSSVARNRGMDEDAVRATEALTFTASQSLSNGLADSVGPLDDAMFAYANDLSASDGDDEMSTQETAAVDQAALDAAHARGVAEGTAAGAAAMQARIGEILTSANAAGRESLANHLAFKTSMSVEDAVAALAAAPIAAAAPQKKEGGSAETFEEAMADGNPEVGADANGNANQGADKVEELKALAAKAGLKGFAKAH